MPIYTYKCVSCDVKRDVDHSMMDSPEVVCKECGGACIKLPGVGSVQFRGTGWGSD